MHISKPNKNIVKALKIEVCKDRIFLCYKILILNKHYEKQYINCRIYGRKSGNY